MAEVRIHPSAEVEAGARVGAGTVIWQLAHVRHSAVLGAECTIGRGVFVDEDVVLGDRVKVQNHALLYRPARIGSGVFVGPAVVLTNDPYPRAVTVDGARKAVGDWEAVGITLEDGCSLGARSVLLPGVTVGRWALVAAGSVVTRDVPAARRRRRVAGPAARLGRARRRPARGPRRGPVPLSHDRRGVRRGRRRRAAPRGAGPRVIRAGTATAHPSPADLPSAGGGCLLRATLHRVAVVLVADASGEVGVSQVRCASCALTLEVYWFALGDFRSPENHEPTHPHMSPPDGNHFAHPSMQPRQIRRLEVEGERRAVPAGRERAVLVARPGRSGQLPSGVVPALDTHDRERLRTETALRLIRVSTRPWRTVRVRLVVVTELRDAVAEIFEPAEGDGNGSPQLRSQ